MMGTVNYLSLRYACGYGSLNSADGGIECRLSSNTGAECKTSENLSDFCAFCLNLAVILVIRQDTVFAMAESLRLLLLMTLVQKEQHFHVFFD